MVTVAGLRPRQIYFTMQKIWGGDKSKGRDLFPSCDDLVTSACVRLGDGGNGGALSSMLGRGGIFGAGGSAADGSDDGKGGLTCSGHGTCTTVGAASHTKPHRHARRDCDAGSWRGCEQPGRATPS